MWKIFPVFIQLFMLACNLSSVPPMVPQSGQVELAALTARLYAAPLTATETSLKLATIDGRHHTII
jgi:hypothetical protein